MAGRTARRRVLRVRAAAPGGQALPGPDGETGARDGQPAGPAATPPQARADLLAVEEPLEIRVNGAALTVTMRTPGDDLDLAAGFLTAEGVVDSPDQIASIRMCDENVADVTLRAGVTLPSERLRRNFVTTSACGVCGKDSIAAIRVRASFDVSSDRVAVDPAVLAALPDRLRQAQRVFASTGGLHAAGLFRADGTLLVLREDVGRHNAVDKIVGWALRERMLPLSGHLLLVSGRASFELAQKALMAGIPVLAAVSAPSSLAAELAEDSGMTLVGFLRGTSMNVYTGAQRLASLPGAPRPSRPASPGAPRFAGTGAAGPVPGNGTFGTAPRRGGHGTRPGGTSSWQFLTTTPLRHRLRAGPPGRRRPCWSNWPNGSAAKPR